MKNPNQNEFRDFQTDSSLAMPRSLEAELLSSIQKKLNPTFASVFIKTSIIQLLVGFVLILLCPQLGVGFSYRSYLMDFFMLFGHHACTFLCGSLFLSLGVVGNVLVLAKEELRLFYKKSLTFQVLILTVSLIILLLLGAKGQYLIFALWAGGGLIASLSLVKFGFKGKILTKA